MASEAAFNRPTSTPTGRYALPEIIEPTPTLHGDAPAAAAPAGLGDRNELAAIAVERTRMPMVITDARQADQPIVLANRAFLDLTGYAAEEVIGRNCRMLQGPETSREAVSKLRQAVAEGREIEIEVLNYRKDGSSFWNQLSISPVYDDAGRLLYFFGSQIDVTELRRVSGLEASEQRLLLEVDHRARNVLAVVNSIVRLSKAEDAVHYADAVQQRVHALAEAHGLLAERRWRGVPVDQLVRRQLDAHGWSRVRLEGPDLTVSPFAVQPLALALFELAADAVSQGALADAEHALAVRWRQAEGPRTLELTWEETGVQRPAGARDPGFGVAVVAGLIERQLRGEVRREWRDDGLRVILSAPDALAGAGQ